MISSTWENAISIRDVHLHTDSIEQQIICHNLFTLSVTKYIFEIYTNITPYCHIILSYPSDVSIFHLVSFAHL